MKTSKKAKYPTMQIVEGVREGKKVRQRTIAHLGVVKDKSDLKRLKDLADKLIQRLEKEGLEIDPKVALEELRHKETIYDGFNVVIDQLMDNTGFSKILRSANGKYEFNLENVIKLLIINRIDDPSSKLRAFERQTKYGFSEIDLQHIYRSMDILITLDNDIQKQAFETVSKESSGFVDCLFFDVTTLYFESVIQDDLKDFGFSKDQKHHSVQIVLALAVDVQGIPVAYDVFKGNIAETKTLIPVLERLRKRFSIKNVTVVCDRGLASKTNVIALQESNFQFVIATKLRSMSKKLKINDLSTYETLNGQEGTSEEERVKFRSMPHPQYENTQLIATYSPSRAEKDRRDRERLITKLKSKISENGDESTVKKVISNSGYKKYTTVKSGSLVSINEKAIEEDEKWDGFHGIAISNGSGLTIAQALSRYRDLYHIEEAFRVAKYTLKTRPIFHRSSERIKSHILICFMSLFLERYLELLLRKNNEHLTPDRIRLGLSQVHTTIFEDEATKRLGRMQSVLPEDVKKIYRTLGISTERRTFLANVVP